MTPEQIAEAGQRLARLEQEDDGEVAIDYDPENARSMSVSIGERSLGYSMLWNGKTVYGRVEFSAPLPPELLEALDEAATHHTASLEVVSQALREWVPREDRELTKQENPMEQIPTIGRIVHYRLSADDAAQINRRRTTAHSIAERMKIQVSDKECITPILAWPTGAQAHIGNEAKEGDVFPMLIVKCWGDTPTACVNGQVFIDGNDVLWATSVSVGEGPRSFSWPTRA